MPEEFNEKTVLKLDGIVTVRSVPQTEQGSSELRLLRDHFIKQIKANSGQDVEIPFPTVYHMAIHELCVSKGLVAKE